MAGKKLHAFDIELGEHVLSVIRCHLSDSAFGQFVAEQLDPPLLDHLRALSANANPSAPSLPLSFDEYLDLEAVFGNGPPVFDKDWIPDSSLYNRAIHCVADIRAGLAPTYADEWARACQEFAAALKKDGLWLSHAIPIVREWSEEIRRLLLAMEATHLVPPPDGTCPTPTCLEPRPQSKLDPDPEQVARVRRALRETGPEAKPNAVTQKAQMSRQECRRVLRYLQSRDEYSGFTRPHRNNKPSR